jgi:hypothetical protein
MTAIKGDKKKLCNLIAGKKKSSNLKGHGKVLSRAK